jgi:hypothetical protein
LADVLNACDFLEATGRTVPRSKWVDELREERAVASFDALM